MESVQRVLWSVVYLIEAVIIILANILSLSIFVRKFRHCKTYFLLINLSIADLLVGFYTLRISIFILTTTTGYKDENGCLGLMVSVSRGYSNAVVLESLSTLTLIAIERAFAVIKPLRHRVVETKYYRYAIVVTWCISVIPGALIVVMRCEAYAVRELVNFSLVKGYGVVSLTIMIISYVAIYIKMRFYPVFQHNANTQMQMKLCKTLFIATVASCIAYLPYTVSNFYYNHICFPACSPSLNWGNASAVLMFSNSFVNCFIYAWRVPAFGSELRKMCFFCKPAVIEDTALAVVSRQNVTISNPIALGELCIRH